VTLLGLNWFEAQLSASPQSPELFDLFIFVPIEETARRGICVFSEPIGDEWHRCASSVDLGARVEMRTYRSLPVFFS